MGCVWYFLCFDIWVFLLGCFWCFLNFKVRVWGVSYLMGLGFGRFLLFVSRPADPPHSLLGHGLGNWAAKLRHGTVGFSCSFLVRPADAPLRPEPGGWLG